MIHASLFSGIGGFDLAAQWMGWNNAFNCEINPFCRRVLNYHFPNSISYEDIATTDFSKWRGRIDILTGGFPCQPFSLAGKRKGKEDNRYLWDEMLRAIRQIQPTWIVGENVAGILTMVQPGQTIALGRETTLFGEDSAHEEIHHRQYTIEVICADLERESYTVQPFIIPACAVGAPHRRDRVWIIAHHNGDRCRHRTNQPKPIPRSSSTSDNSNGSTNRNTPDSADSGLETLQQQKQNRVLSVGTAADTERSRGSEIHQKVQFQQSDGTRVDCEGFERATADTSGEQRKRYGSEQPGSCEQKQRELGRSNSQTSAERIPDWRMFPTQSPVCSRNDGLSSLLDAITFPKWREESVKAYGNAIVPQVAYEIFKAIQSEQKPNN